MKTKALILGLIALAAVAQDSVAQGGKGGGANKVDSVTGIVISPPSGGAGPSVKWNSIDKATFQVQRSKSGDSCCNYSSPAGLTSTTWQDAALPSSGTYVYRVVATLNSGQVAGQAQYVYTAPPPPPPPPAPAPAPAPIVAVPIAPAPITVMPASPISPPAAIAVISPAPAPAPAPIVMTAQPAAAPVIGVVASSGGGAATGQYRVTMTGIQVGKQTVDDLLDRDGKADEIYAASIIVRVDRTTGSRNAAPTIVKSREYGDVGNGQWPLRIRAGTALPSGGLTGGNAVPIGFTPSSPSGAPGDETFPFKLWEGTLTQGGEAVVLFPSLWERDIDDVAYKNYTGNWMNNKAPILESQYMKNQYSSNALMATVGPSDAATFAQAAAGTTFTQPIYGVYAWPALSLTAPVDRPIGMTTIYGALGYQERIVVLTQEKLASLAVGATTDLQIPLIEGAFGTDGIYTVYIRIERIS